eukprot:11197073-Lingulodinium_polyedra.AAC.1
MEMESWPSFLSIGKNWVAAVKLCSAVFPSDKCLGSLSRTHCRKPPAGLWASKKPFSRRYSPDSLALRYSTVFGSGWMATDSWVRRGVASDP